MKEIILVIALLIVSSQKTCSQSVSVHADTIANESFASFGIRYKSDYYYMGRSDSAKAPYVIPTFGYYHKSGLSLSGSISYLMVEDEGRVDLYTLTAGYDYFGDKVMTGIYIDEYFFSNQSYSIQAEMRTYASAYFGYDFMYFTLQADASLGLSSNLDVFLGGELNHTFYTLHNRLLITPSFSTNMGTQKYYNEYYAERSITTGNSVNGGNGGTGTGTGTGSGQGSGQGQSSGSGPASGQGPGRIDGSGSRVSSASSTSPTTITDIKVLESEKFQVLDYELGLYTSYKLGHFRLALSSRLLLPVNPSTIETDQYFYKEDLKTGFYWTAGIRYLLK